VPIWMNDGLCSGAGTPPALPSVGQSVGRLDSSRIYHLDFLAGTDLTGGGIICLVELQINETVVSCIQDTEPVSLRLHVQKGRLHRSLSGIHECLPTRRDLESGHPWRFQERSHSRGWEPCRSLPRQAPEPRTVVPASERVDADGS